MPGMAVSSYPSDMLPASTAGSSPLHVFAATRGAFTADWPDANRPSSKQELVPVCGLCAPTTQRARRMASAAAAHLSVGDGPIRKGRAGARMQEILQIRQHRGRRRSSAGAQSEDGMGAAAVEPQHKAVVRIATAQQRILCRERDEYRPRPDTAIGGPGDLRDLSQAAFRHRVSVSVQRLHKPLARDWLLWRAAEGGLGDQESLRGGVMAVEIIARIGLGESCRACGCERLVQACAVSQARQHEVDGAVDDAADLRDLLRRLLPHASGLVANSSSKL